MNISIDLSKVVIKTKRLILRPWTMNDLDDFFEYASVDGVGQMAGWLPHKTKGFSADILKKIIDEKKTFALEYNGKVIGSLGVEQYNETDLPEYSQLRGREIGYVLSKNYWGLGLMPEAVIAVCNYLFNVLELDFLVCGHFLSNDQSRRVQEKTGFKHYKIVKHETRYGEIKDTWISLLHREEFLNNK